MGRWLLLGLAVASLAGCDRLRSRQGYLADGTGRKPQLPANLSRELAHQQPVSAPVPPSPPPLPSEPPVTPPRPDALAAGIPNMPGATASEAVVAPTMLIVQTGAVALPDDANAATFSGEGDEKKPLRERVKERREERDERRNPPPAKPDAKDPPPAPRGATDDLTAVKKILDAATKRYADLEDFEARLVKREVVQGKALPQDEIAYRFRKSPLSVSMKVLSAEGQGREVMYVKGQFGDKIHVLTGKGDNLIVGVGYKTEMEPDSKTATAKSRYRIYEAGFGRTLGGLAKALNPADTTQAPMVKPLGLVTRKEVGHALEGVEVTIRAGQDPLLPRGGRRQVYFDPKPDSPAYLFPVLVVTTEPDGKEVEYYFFDQVKVPSGLKDSDWNPANLGKKK